jgi:hypothetical protein
MVYVMKRFMIFLLGLFAAVVFGCGAMQAHSQSKIVPITTFKQVSGKWEGLSKRMPDMREHAQVFLFHQFLVVDFQKAMASHLNGR